MSKAKTSFFDTIRRQKEAELNVDEQASASDISSAFSGADTMSLKEESTLFVPEDEQEQNDQISDNEEFEEFTNAIYDIIGSISPERMKGLFEKYKNKENKVLLAIDEYLKGEETSTKSTKRQIMIPPISLETNPKRKRTRGVQIPFSYPKNSAFTTALSSPIKTQEDTSFDAEVSGRYLGTIFAEAFTTRPYMKPLPHKKRLTLRSLKPRKLTGKEKKKSNDTAIIRLYISPNDELSDEREIGRFKEDLTRVFAPLLDLNLAQFEVSVAMATKTRLSIADTFYLKIDCYLTSQAFEKRLTESNSDLGIVKKSSLQKAKFNFASETEGETELRMRQHAISALFSRLQVKAVRLRGNKEVLDYTQAPAPDTEAPEVVDQMDESDEEETQNELSLDQLQTFYSENQQSEMLKALPDTTKPPVENFSMDLRPYQRLGLSWMLAREKELDTLKLLTEEDGDKSKTMESLNELQMMEEGVMNPLWKTFKWPKQEDTKQNESEGDKYFYGNMYSGELSKDKPLIQSTVKGGILADEMGLGKTISTLALVNSVPYDTRTSFSGPGYANQTTLVIVPMSLLSQWQKEFDRANNNLNHKCIVYYGQQTVADLSTLLVNKTKHIPILMLTTYGTVQSEFAKIESRRDSVGNLPKTGLFSVKFFRIILDEGHNIRTRTNKTTRAIFELQASRKWVLTGTPIVNRLDDLYSIVKFLELEPWNNFSYWKMFITIPFEQKQVKQTLDVIKTILEPIFLRRTKLMKGADGKPLVELPPKEVVIEPVKFSEREERLYQWFKDKAYRQFNENLKSGELLKKYSQILTHILRLRQVCCHPDLIKSVVNDMEEDIAKMEAFNLDDNVLKEIFEDTAGDKFKDQAEMNDVKYSLYDKINLSASECSICTNNPIDSSEMIITPCGHGFCLNCLMEHIEFQSKNNQNDKPTCPNCRGEISKYKLFKVRTKPTTTKEFKFHTKKTIEEDYPYDLYVYDPTKVSAKIQALINHIVTLKDQNICEPIIVFSQFSSYLDIIDNELTLHVGERSIRCLKFHGRLSETQRQQILEEFSKSTIAEPDRITVLLISLKAGGVGLNLTNASRAFLMDPWWSPAVEDQAIDRLHRIGQEKSVKVIRFVMENSIEMNMLKIQERKKQLGDVVSLEEEEKRKNRIEEIKILFEN